VAKLDNSERSILEFQLSYKRWDTLDSVVTTLIKWGTLLGIAWLFRGTIESLAGKATHADIAIKVLGNIKVSRGLVALFAVGGWVYGLGERSLRRRHIKRVTTQKNELENVIDARRTSSDLTPTGTTPPKKRRK
jgi:hypothetical protein